MELGGVSYPSQHLHGRHQLFECRSTLGNLPTSDLHLFGRYHGDQSCGF